MPLGQDVGGLAEPDAAGLGRDRHLGHQRVGAELRPLGLKVVLGHEIEVVAELLGQHPLADLVDHDALEAGVHVLETASRDQHARGRVSDRQVRGAVLKDAKLDHDGLPSHAQRLSAVFWRCFPTRCLGHNTLTSAAAAPTPDRAITIGATRRGRRRRGSRGHVAPVLTRSGLDADDLRPSRSRAGRRTRPA